MAEPIKGQGSLGNHGGFNDRRARLSPKPFARQLIYGPRNEENILLPLYESGGLMWPYTPNIVDQATVLYDTYDPMHSNQPFAAFKSVAMKEIICTGQFTAQNQDEARYSIAAIHFLRTVTKMFFGLGNSNGTADQRQAVSLRGTPPPILLFNAWGTAVYHNVPVIVTNYTAELPPDVDYVRVIFPGGNTKRYSDQFSNIQIDPSGQVQQTLVRRQIDQFTGDISAWVPSRFNIAVSMQVQNTPDRWRRQFNLNDFRTGALVKKGGWV